jgi:hypothetical protein
MGCSFLSEVLQLSPGLRSPMALTPTPPWVASGNVAGLENEAVEQAAENPLSGGEAEPAPKKIKRVRLQLDARIELTNEELKVSKFSCYSPQVSGEHVTVYQTARARYIEGQEVIRRSIEDKKLEKEGAHLISQMLYGVPQICEF